MRIVLIILLALGSIIGTLRGVEFLFGSNFVDISRARNDPRRPQPPTIRIVVWNDPEDHIRRGAELARRVINESGGLLGRPLVIDYYTDHEDFTALHSTIRRAALNLDIIAAIGHSNADVALSAGIIYENAGMIYLSPFSTDPYLSTLRNRFSFTTAPDSEVLAEQFVNLTQEAGYYRLAMFFERDRFHTNEITLFYDQVIQFNQFIAEPSEIELDLPKFLNAAPKQAIQFVYGDFFTANEEFFQDRIIGLEGRMVDAVIISAQAHRVALFVEQLRDAGFTMPVITFNPRATTTIAQRALETYKDLGSIIVPTLYNPNAELEINQSFVEMFRQTYNALPNYLSAQIYDSIGLLGRAISESRSTLPFQIAGRLRTLPFYIGATGVYAFNRTNSVRSRFYYFKQWDGNDWRMMPGAHHGYAIRRFLIDTNAQNESTW